MDENDTSATAETVTDSAADFGSAVDALAEILDDPETDTDENEALADDEAEGDDLSDEDGEETEDDSEEDSGEDNAEEGKDGPDELKGGRIAPNSAKVKLPDGSLITVEELSKGYLRQSDYTRKRQEDSVVRRELDADRERVSQTAQQLHQTHERMNAMLEQWKPQPPQTRDDPMGWITYQQNLAAWEQWQQQLDSGLKETREKQQADLETEYRQRAMNERKALSERVPALADDTKFRAFLNEAGKVLGEYGITQKEVETIGDHRMFLVVRDLMRAKRLSAKAPEVKEKMKDKPKMLTGNKRSNPGVVQKQGRDARLSRLRETGSRADAVRSLMDLDL